jgi:UDP-N-acetylglucosamine--N-acetylmuramyl-(pentapeptide) pyrophosphoryl-undecaprenol N-acetylglucosamine transferase
MSGIPFVVLAAGGTGGHVFPAEALAAELGQRGCRLALVTDQRGGNLRAAPEGLTVHRVMAAGMAGKSFAARLRSAPELALGTIQARRLLKRLAPDVVVGFGGYASAPAVFAAGLIGIPTAIHEQNAVLGRANRLLASRASLIATSFADCAGVPAASSGRIRRTGMPLRTEFTSARNVAYMPIVEDGPINLMVLGGSQGALFFSEVMPEAVAQLPEAWRRRVNIVQQCRAEDLDAVRRAYLAMRVTAELATFFDDVPVRMARAHLIICRSGASTVAELTAIGRPAILVPYPYAIDDHQTANAYAVDGAGAGWLMPQDFLTPQSLAARLESLFILSSTLTTAASCARAAGLPDAAKRLADAVLNLLPNGTTEETRVAA